MHHLPCKAAVFNKFVVRAGRVTSIFNVSNALASETISVLPSKPAIDN